MGWVYSIERQGPIVQWEGNPPEYVYHWTTPDGLRAILRDKVIKPGYDNGNSGLATGGEEGVSFTDLHQPTHPILKAELRLRTRDIPGIMPVTYVMNHNRLKAGSQTTDLSLRGEQVRSGHWVDEHEWHTNESVPLRPGKFSHTPLTWFPIRERP